MRIFNHAYVSEGIAQMARRSRLFLSMLMAGSAALGNGPAMAQFASSSVGFGLNQTSPLKVVDSKGKFVGNLLSINMVVMNIGGQPLVVSLEPFGFNAWNPAELSTNGGYVRDLYFETADCSGQAFVAVTSMPLMPAQVVQNSGSSVDLHYPKAGTYKFVNAKSSTSPQASRPACQPWGSSPIFAGQAVKVSITGFTPPFSVK
jgi:hypothetical protein